MAKTSASILFLGKEGDGGSLRALALCQSTFAHVESRLGQWLHPFPQDLPDRDYDYLISYLSRWIVPDRVLKRIKGAALNFHPASPEYPGYGCYGFALYDNATSYGVTCHHMTARVDGGDIVAVERFPIYEQDDVSSLVNRTYEYLFRLFGDIAVTLESGEALPVSADRWARKAYTRKDYLELQRVTPGMSREEIARRIRATSFGEWQPFIEIGGYIFQLKR